MTDQVGYKHVFPQGMLRIDTMHQDWVEVFIGDKSVGYLHEPELGEKSAFDVVRGRSELIGFASGITVSVLAYNILPLFLPMFMKVF